MQRKTLIYSVIDDKTSDPKGAVEVCNYFIVDDLAKSGYKMKIIKIPIGSSFLKNIYRNFTLISKMFYNGMIFKNIIFIYPTIPFIPTTSNKKYYIAKSIYSIFFLIKKFFKTKIVTFILDYPLEQDKGLNVHNVRVNPKLLEAFESKLLKESDVIVTYSDGFSALTNEKHPVASNKIVQLEFSPVRILKTEKPVELEKTLLEYISNYETIIFYSGDLTREYERDTLSILFNKINNNTGIIVCGNGGEWINQAFARGNIKYLGFIDSSTHNFIASLCSFGIILYPNKGYYKITPSTKLSVYINALLPVLAIENDTNISLFKKYNIGEAVSENLVVDKIIEWSKEKKYLNYKDNVIETKNIINGLHDIKKVISKLERII